MKSIKLKPLKFKQGYTESYRTKRFENLLSASSNSNDSPKQINGGWFCVNKGGFPINAPTWDRMWTFASKQHPDGLYIRNQIENEVKKQIPIAKAPLNTCVLINSKLDSINSYFKTLQYNHTGTQFFDIKKHQPLHFLMDTAKEIINESLPIKCLEAVIVAIYLTSNIEGLDRFTIGFKSKLNGCTHQHVVLGLHYKNKYGSIGMSRRNDLMSKPLEYDSLADLILDFKKSYENYSHILLRVKIGMTVTHDIFSYESIQWGVVSLNVNKIDNDTMIRELDKATRYIRRASKWNTNYIIYSSPIIKKKKFTVRNEKP